MSLVRSLRHRNFRLFFAGQAFSLIGIWMQGTAVSWLTWRLTHSPVWLGAVGFATQIPILIVGLVGGAIADRTARHRLVIIIQVAAMIQAIMLAILTLSGSITVHYIFLLSLFLGLVFAFDYPARQAFLMDMVGREDIGNAVALNSSVVHGARVLGPMAAGFIVAAWGEGACFAINAASFLFVLTSLFIMKKKELYPQSSENNHSIRNSIYEALQIVWNTREIKRPLIIMGTLSLAAMPYVILLPQVVNEKFGGGARDLGFAMSSAGLGALIGAVSLTIKKGTQGLYSIVRWSLMVNGAGLLIFSVMPALYIAVPALILIGLAGFLVVAGTNTILQVASPPESRGRIMSVFTVTFFGITPIGSLLSGQVAEIIGASWTIAMGGAVCIAVAVGSFFRQRQRNC